MIIVGAVVILITAATGTVLLSGPPEFRIEACSDAGRPPRISPDYGGIRIPYNLAPPNFVVEEAGDRYQVRFSAGAREFRVSSYDPGIRIPVAPWKELLAENRGEQLRIDVCVDEKGVGWKKYQTLVDEISDDPIDPYLVYRELYPQFYIKANMRIRERSLTDFGERSILDSRQFAGGGCVNCHTFQNYDGNRFVIQVRHGGQNYMLLSDEGKVSLVQTVASQPGSAYLSWHPSGKALAVSVDMGYMIFNLLAGAVPEEMLEFADTAGDVAVYRVAENRLSTAPAISREDRVETQPDWSPDGSFLYYVSAPQVPLERYQEIQYDLRRIAYDIESDTFGESETLVSAPDEGISCSFPKASPDGRFLLFCASDRSSFTILRSETDLCLMDLRDGSWRRLEINSDRTDSYHAWTSNGAWIGFVSKRWDGIHGHVWFSHVDEDGSVSKPFVLPQSDPRYYETFLKTYNAPQFVRSPVNAEQFALGRQATAIEEIIRSR